MTRQELNNLIEAKAAAYGFSAKREGERITEVANLTTHCSDEKYLVFILARRAYHTSAVLLKPEPQSTVESKK